MHAKHVATSNAMANGSVRDTSIAIIVVPGKFFAQKINKSSSDNAFAGHRPDTPDGVPAVVKVEHHRYLKPGGTNCDTLVEH